MKAIILALFLSISVHADYENITRILETPDFTKTQPQIPNQGAGYCGPSSVSNSLIWLVKKGKLDKILNKTTNSPLLQWELVTLLGSNSYMRTASEGGTSATQLVEGLDRFMSNHIKKDYKITYTGIKSVPSKYKEGEILNPPSLADIKASLIDDNVGWINAGWYKKGKRIGSSWMTIVGLEEKNNQTHLILHDPNPRAGEKESSEKVLLKKVNLDDGKIYYQLSEGMHIKETADTALLDGIVILKL